MLTKEGITSLEERTIIIALILEFVEFLVDLGESLFQSKLLLNEIRPFIGQFSSLIKNNSQ